MRKGAGLQYAGACRAKVANSLLNSPKLRGTLSQPQPSCTSPASSSGCRAWDAEIESPALCSVWLSHSLLAAAEMPMWHKVSWEAPWHLDLPSLKRQLNWSLLTAATCTVGVRTCAWLADASHTLWHSNLILNYCRLRGHEDRTSWQRNATADARLSGGLRQLPAAFAVAVPLPPAWSAKVSVSEPDGSTRAASFFFPDLAASALASDITRLPCSTHLKLAIVAVKEKCKRSASREASRAGSFP